ncbi:MAG: nucleotidyltransferase domain-containing protein [Propionibacteriaceae bacterium]|nr:nucleotidyltransferase domain-containing protein [Propionibacteriaceae bacterium]
MRFGEPFGGLFPGARGAVLAALLRTGAPLTGRQVHALARDAGSLWSAQQALTDLSELGIIEFQTIGRANVYTVNEAHYAIEPLRTLLDPFAALRATIADTMETSVEAVILFGSTARGEATATSDIDLAVLAPDDWDGRAALEDAIHGRLGNSCDVIAFTAEQFGQLAANGDEPVVAEILADGIALLGAIPRPREGVA